MIAPLDVFAVEDGDSLWLGCAETLSKALELPLLHGEGLYFVFSQSTGHKEFYRVNSDGTVVPMSGPVSS